ncbi:MAG: hypothetical protein ACK5LP_00005, partial [Campylobacteraceae bacterium]
MLKKLTCALLIFTCTSIFADDNSVIIKADGDFAKELKALFEKYEAAGGNGSLEIIDEKKLKDQNSPIEQAIQEQIKIDSSNPAQQTKQDIYRQYFSDDAGVIKKQEGNVLEGRAIYEKTCFKCHGKEAEKSTYSSARNLINLSKEDLISQLENYKRDSGYGSSGTGMVMRSKA